MHAQPTPLAGLMLLQPKVFGDDRGFFFESFNARVFAQVTGCNVDFVQDNHSRSTQGYCGDYTTKSNSRKENWCA